MRLVWVWFWFCLAASFGLPASAMPSPTNFAGLCERASNQAAAETGVPADILGTLTLTETGRRQDGGVRPWAWSVNSEGSGTWFDDPQSALEFARGRLSQGRTNLDIGCFQLNYRWHGENFASVEQMFDPLTNARYAARFVSQLYQETGDWRQAAGAFHSRNAAFANKYLTRFDTLREVFRQQGFDGMSGTEGTYNRFAVQEGGDEIAGNATPRRRQNLLGADLDAPGFAEAGRGLARKAGSLAVAPESSGHLLRVASGPLFGEMPPPPP